jgi:hypothetical protein
VRTIPIVFVLVSDPIGGGFVESLAHSGGNVLFTPAGSLATEQKGVARTCQSYFDRRFKLSKSPCCRTNTAVTRTTRSLFAAARQVSVHVPVPKRCTGFVDAGYRRIWPTLR